MASSVRLYRRHDQLQNQHAMVTTNPGSRFVCLRELYKVRLGLFLGLVVASLDLVGMTDWKINVAV
jgi:hypothetical protein